ncbi:MAG TPA: sigma-70 family RNA polymerase sigma factor [Solirubrobacterales bacterium]|nr:sigma-70 family RNA polymerase sigma factor [Solirubrobacterales bacterium]
MSQTAVAEARKAPREDGIAFDRLYRSSRDDVYAYVASLLRDGPAAEEVTATAFERAYRKRHRFDPGKGEPRAWLFGIARNAALDELRRRGRQAELAAEPEDVDGAAVEASAEKSERRLALRAAGHILTIAAGVALIALAVLAPIALIALLVWMANRFRVRRLRERALG